LHEIIYVCTLSLKNLNTFESVLKWIVLKPGNNQVSVKELKRQR